MAIKKLSELASTIRSKNAGVDKITFDIIFSNRDNYRLVRDSGRLSRAALVEFLGIPDEMISDHVEFEPAPAIKFTVYRTRPSGSPGDPDIFGAQQYAPLLDLEIEVPEP
jgi:hypothetical protein